MESLTPLDSRPSSSPVKKKGAKNRGCLKALLFLGLAAGVALWIAGVFFFNLDSNLVALSVRDSKEPLLIRGGGGIWKAAPKITAAEIRQGLIERHAEQGMRWSTLKIKRGEGSMAKVAHQILGAEVHVITFSPEHFEFMTSYEKQPKFAVTTAANRMAEDNLWFSITANFRDPKGKPLGWVWHEGVQVNGAFPEWSGCFFVKGGRPYFGPKSLLDDVPGPIEEGTQGYPSVMKNHTTFSYVSMKPDQFFDGSKITYRSLAGMRKDGTIIFIVSGDGGVMNVAEVTEIARKLEVQHATLLDGGRALQYSIRTEDGPWHFTALNTRLKLNHRWFEQQLSPVFIGVRRRAPNIIRVPLPQ
ncbi:phosphodiester glycosidase family protein [Prosthecobacter fusiformis]|uniref:phosphodiester glycosidase family protein n=1 Tax=Prosthecobacter fusiformis TaxID=48464 RepID=UPI001414D4D7|nr:phosphodiester glycosidase family protein [Prosthecobacter fusiformis]